MKTHRINITVLTLILTSWLLTSCSIHKIDIQQGNVLTTEVVSKITTGMNKKQVRFLLGNPSIEDPFHQNRWDYSYTFTAGTKNAETERNHVTLWFENELVARIETNMLNKTDPDN